MRITCEHCGAQYNLPSGLPSDSTFNTTCRRCGGRMEVSLNADSTEIRTRSISSVQKDMSAPIDADLSLGPAVELKEKNSDAPPLSSDKEMNADDHTIEFGAKPEETIDEGISTIATPALVHDFDDLLPDDPTQEDQIIPPPPIISFAPDDDPALSATSTQRVRAAKQEAEYSQLILGAALLSCAALFGTAALKQGDLGHIISSGVALAGLTLIVFITLTSGYGRQSAKLMVSYCSALFFGVLFAFGIFVSENGTRSNANTRIETLASQTIETVAASKDKVVKTPASSSIQDKTVPIVDAKIVSKKRDKKKTKLPKSSSTKPTPSEKKTDTVKEKEAQINPTEEIQVQDQPKEAEPAPYVQPNSEPVEFDAQPPTEEANKVVEPPVATGLPDKVIKGILLKNKDITKCFLKERSNNGKVPDEAPLRFIVNPKGYVVSMKVYKGRFVGSSFERCLRSAIRRISFPPFEGENQVIRHVLRPG